MIDDLKFIVGAVARKDYVESLCHLLIKDGRAMAYDGLLAMSTTIPIDLHVKPHAKKLMLAVKACENSTTMAMHVTPGGKLSIKSGKFKAFVDCLDNEAEMDLPMPDGEDVEITDELFQSIVDLAPFMAIDASRPWAMGIRIVGNSTYVTNNIIFIERWHGSNFKHEVIIPADAIKELLKINQKPTRVQMTRDSITFWFGPDRWMRTALIDGQWPENIERLFMTDQLPQAFPDGFFDALDTLKPFVDERGRVYLLEDRMSTTNEDGVGASVELVICEGTQIFHLAQLQLLRETAAKIDFTAYPKPCMFVGKRLRGVIAGLLS